MSTPNYDWLCQNFVQRTPDVAHAVVVSADGVLIASSRALPSERANQVAAISSGLLSLAQGAARCFDGGEVLRTMVEMQGGYLFVMAISDGASLVVLAAPGGDTATVGYEMARFVARVGTPISPEPRSGALLETEET
ncbi:MAG: roadblock/LC7 domain-containing protein [Kutzneria sp.]|nr:roadblock/LC7 domain-containing protein [Kutzneria sp.]MBV9843832.1 roadblock/LC7 domain-containing protein [Kutzneria sp.]